jgi:geranylgeranyl reductase family protein
LTYDVIIAGAGPAGTATAWRAATQGARVLVCDRATFPREKACGDGITPRGAKLLDQMGLAKGMKRFQRTSRVRIVRGKDSIERPWPIRDGFPRFGYVADRVAFDHLLLTHAANAGATIRDGCEVIEPIISHGAVRGMRVRSGSREEMVPAPISIAADGSASRLCRLSGLMPLSGRPIALAMRAHVDSPVVLGDALQVYVPLLSHGVPLPGYGWVFPMADGRLNIGVGYMAANGVPPRTNLRELMDDFVCSLPREWGQMLMQDLRRAGALGSSRIPMGFYIWPPVRPGLMAVGDAAGVAKPFTGVGISKAIESGFMAADSALEALGTQGPSDLSSYERRLQNAWGSYYRIGRAFIRSVQSPSVVSKFLAACFAFPQAIDQFGQLFAHMTPRPPP